MTIEQIVATILLSAFVSCLTARLLMTKFLDEIDAIEKTYVGRILEIATEAIEKAQAPK